MTNSGIRISVAIPTYNQGQYLEKAILSAFNQTLKPFEIVVSNDFSTDDTRERLEKMALQVPVLKVINQPVNLGINGNVDACLRASSGDFVLRLDSDDYLEQDYIKILSGLLDEFPEAGYAHANIAEIDQFDQLLKKRILSRSNTYQSGEDALKAAVKGYRVAANILMFRRSALESVDYMSNRPDFGEDYHLAADLAANGWGNVFSPKILARYRVWVDAGKVRQKRKMSELQGLLSVFTEVIIPAFEKRKWDKKSIEKSRETIACSQADCLGWDIYTRDEITELTAAVLKLSSSGKTKKFIWANKNGYGAYLKRLRQMERRLKSFIKNKMVGIRTSS